ncbi:hypothetical protein Plhal304r1_c007g0029391 [Plasmopara halstedii]
MVENAQFSLSSASINRAKMYHESWARQLKKVDVDSALWDITAMEARYCIQ